MAADLRNELAGYQLRLAKQRRALDRFEDTIVGLLPRLRRLARALVRDRALADALVQLTVERTLAQQGRRPPGSPVDSWAMRIMGTAWLERSPRLVAAAATTASAALPPAGSTDPQDAVFQALDQLPDDQRLAVALVLVEGLSYAETAEVLEIPQSALAGRLARGRQALMEFLEA